MHWKSLEQKQKERLSNFMSGLVAGVISVTVCNPLDIARTRLNVMVSISIIQNSPNHQNNRLYTGFLHTMQTIWKQEGFKGFYTGYSINIKAIPLFHSIFFPIYEGMKLWCSKKQYPKWKQYLLSTIVAGGICNIITNPIWVVRTRIMVQFLHPEANHYQNKNSISHIMMKMIKEEGILSLFRGLTASILSISNAIIYFYLYETLKDQIKDKMHSDFSSRYVFLASMLSKLIASTLTYPLIVIRTIMHDHRKAEKISNSQIISHILREKGLTGLYAGLKPDLIRLLPSNTIVFVVYELMQRKLFHKDHSK